jgi:xanthine dehydrogenase accessory factor
MIEAEVFAKISEALKNNKPAALVTVLSHAGSSPGKQGSVMAVLSNGETYGTVGGGSLEHTATKEALEAIKTGTDKELSFDLTDDGMMCGGKVRLYIKTFAPSERLIICGGGHIGQKLYQLGIMQGFAVTVIDDRAEFANGINFPDASEVICGDVGKALSEMNIDDTCYIAIATRSHETDFEALGSAVGTKAAYIGMIGSRKKVNTVMDKLSAEGIGKAVLDKIYAPMGLDIATVKTEEIALSIISEIMLVKNGGNLRHMKDR